MAKLKMKAIIMPFKEPMLDKEGNPIKTLSGLIRYKTVYRKVLHNAAYFPSKYIKQIIPPAKPKV